MMDELRAFLAAIVESSDDAIIGLDSYGQILSWNRGAGLIYGYSRNEVLGRPISLLSLPEHAEEVFRMQKSLQGGEPVCRLRTTHLDRNGHSHYVFLSMSPIVDPFGIVIGASLIGRDITKQLKDEEALREAEEKYRQLFCAEQDAIILFEQQTGQICDINPAALQLYNYPEEQFLQLSVENLVCKADTDWLSKNKSIGLHLKGNGKRFEAEISLGTFTLKGRPLHVMIVRDVSERRRHQQLRQSLALAKEFQQRLLPAQFPQTDGYDIHVQTRYCQEAGGDYYDFFTPNGNGQSGLAFAVGDVSGHSVGAALLMALTKGILQNEVKHNLLDQDRLLRSLNRQLVEATSDSSFMTLFFGHIDTTRQLLHWSSAGHGPVFCYRPREERFIELPPSDIPLGIDPQACFPQPPPLKLENGDILLIGTDGLWETRNPQGEMYRIERLRQIIATHREKTAAALHALILQKIADFRQTGDLEDDVTLLVIKVSG